MGVVYVVILIRGEREGLTEKRARLKGNLTACVQQQMFFSSSTRFNLKKKKSLCRAQWAHSGEMVHASFNQIMETVRFSEAVTWVKFLFGSLCLLGPAAKCFQFTSSMRLLSATFPKVCFWTFLDHCSSPWTWHINTSCIKSSSSSKFLSASSFLLLVSVCIQLYLVNGGLWLVEPWKASTASHSHFSVSKYLLASIITPVTPFLLSSTASDGNYALFFVENRNIMCSSPCPPPHTWTHGPQQSNIPLGHAFFCLPDWQTHVANQDWWMLGLGSRQLCTTAHTHVAVCSSPSERVKCGPTED